MGIFDSFRRKSSRSSPPAAAESSDVADADADAVQKVGELIWTGFVARDEIEQIVTEFFELAPGDARPAAFIETLWADRLAEQATWDGLGDFDRLRAAFDGLASEGVLTRMNFTCCQTCGTAEIDDERTPLENVPDGEYPWREWAYTFFHEQDTERLAYSPSTLYLGYSFFRPLPETAPELVARARDGDQEARRTIATETDRAVGTLVAQALSDQGLEVEWDGSPGQRIAVTITDWRKPLPA